MQTPQGVALRALIMLGCLVALPMLAVVGTRSPDEIVELLPVSVRAYLFPNGRGLPIASDVTPSITSIPPLNALRIDLGQPAVTLSDDPATVGESADVPAQLVRAEDEIRPASHISPLPTSFPQSLSVAIPSNPTIVDLTSTAIPQEERFRKIEQRLRELGATRYVLETWGISDELYRFRGMVASNDTPHLQRYFNAVDSDPVAAMTRVLEDIEDWRTRH